jgi:hypothetical protein
LSQHLKLDSWLHGFLIDVALYKGRWDEVMNKIGNLTALDTGINGNLRRHLRLASTFYCQGLFAVSSTHIYYILECNLYHCAVHIEEENKSRYITCFQFIHMKDSRKYYYLRPKEIVAGKKGKVALLHAMEGLWVRTGIAPTLS